MVRLQRARSFLACRRRSGLALASRPRRLAQATMPALLRRRVDIPAAARHRRLPHLPCRRLGRTIRRLPVLLLPLLHLRRAMEWELGFALASRLPARGLTACRTRRLRSKTPRRP